jgi:serine/threonine protein kinase/tetratricopeptide (TPR) repeat protein
MIGQTISHYKILSKLGEGGMGVVYEAEDLKLDRRAALKFLPPHLHADDAAKKRFIHEAKAASALDHPNIGTIYEIDETPDGQMFIAMACYRGDTLKRKIEGGPVTEEEAIDIVSQVASGLAKAHDSGIVHRDIKPGNILTTTDGLAKVVDFGVAKLSGATRVTRTGTTVGTVAYMSPEQTRGGEIGPGSDVFSLGVVLYELLTGKLPFGGDHEKAVMYQIVNLDPEPLRECLPDVPEALQNIIDKALAKDPATRYQTASDLLADLEQVRRGGEVVAIKKRRRGIPLRTVMTAAVGAIVVVVAYLLYEQFGPKPSDQPAVSPDVIAVFPFTVRGSEDIQYMGDGVVDLLNINLDGVGDLRTVRSAALMGLVKQRGNGSGLDPARQGAIAEQAGAGLYVSGSIVEAGGKLRMRASIFETTGGPQPRTEASAEGEVDQFMDMVDRLATDLLVERVTGAGEPMARLARQTTDSFEALKAYLEGERHYRSSDYAQAVEACKRAVAADSTFALAYYRIQTAAPVSAEAVDFPPDILENAMRYRGELPENERRLIEALHKYIRDWDPEGAIRLLRQNVNRRPDDIESRLMLARYLFLYGRRQNLWLDEAKAHLEHLLYYNPDDTEAISDLWWLAHDRADCQEAQRRVQQWLELAPEASLAGWFRALASLSTPDSIRKAEALAEFGRKPDLLYWGSIVAAIKMYDDWEGAAAIARLMTEPIQQPNTREHGYIYASHAAFARGRWKEADAALTGLRSYQPEIAIRSGANLSVMPPVQLQQPILESYMQEISQVPDTNRSWEDPYLAGLLSARISRYPDALHYASELDSAASERDSIARAVQGDASHKARIAALVFGDLAQTVRAEVAWLQGDLDRALAEIEKTHPGVPWWPTYSGLIWSKTYTRYLRAFLLEQAGQLEEALRWYGSLGQQSSLGFAYFAAKHLRMGEIYEKLDDREKAIEHYARFVELWKDCDPQFRTMVDDVKDRIARLEG